MIKKHHNLPVFVYIICAFLLNFVWETWHSVYLYQGHEKPMMSHVGSYREFVLLITRVSITDAVLLLVIFLGAIAIWNDVQWFKKITTIKITYFIIVALILAVAIEVKGVHLLHLWQYSNIMPTVFGLGLSPLVQLAITGLSAMWLTRQIKD
jgi:hypothetical protein